VKNQKTKNLQKSVSVGTKQLILRRRMKRHMILPADLFLCLRAKSMEK